jgi:hypothetical protein
MGPEELGAMSANIKSLCDRVTHQSAQIEKLTDKLQSISDQMVAGKSGLQGFKMGVYSSLVLISGAVGAGLSSIVDKLLEAMSK